MANVKISELPSLSTMTDAGEIPVVAGGTTQQITGANLKLFFTANVGFTGDAIYDLNGMIIENADLSHGATAAVIIPSNGNTTAPIQINNTYGNITIGTGPSGTVTGSWIFDKNGTLTLPNNANITTVDNVVTQINAVATANSAINLRTFDANGNIGASTFFDGAAGTLDFYSFNYTTNSSYNWRFDNGGSFTLPNYPGNIYFGEIENQPAILPGATAITLNANRADVTQDYITVSQDGIELFSVNSITINNSTTGFNNSDIVIASGDDIFLRGRNRPNDTEAEGGDLFIYAGQGANSTQTGFDTNGGGDIQIYAGAGGLAQGSVTSGGSGGTIDILAGDGGTSLDSLVGSGGWISLTAGSAATPVDSANGGFGGTVSITAGTTTRVNESGGSISLNTGGSTGGGYGAAGAVEINIPASDAGTGGTWTFTGTGKTLQVPADSEIFGANFGNFTVGCAGNTIVTSSDYGANVKNWIFGYTGNLVVPGPITQNSYDSANLLVATTADTNWAYGFTTNGSTDFYSQIKFFGDSSATRGAKILDTSSSNAWTFDGTGTLTFPSLANISGGNFNAGTASATVALNAFSPDGNTVSIQAQGNSSSAVISISANAGPVTNDWVFTHAALDPTEPLFYVPGGAAIVTPAATGGAAGKNIFIEAGYADQQTYSTSAGGELFLKGGRGAFNDGGGGGHGGNVNINAGESADPAGHAGNVYITAGASRNWVFDYTGDLNAPGDITTTGNISAHDITSSGNINSAGNFDIDGNATIGGNLFVTGNINFSGNVTQISGNSGVFYGNASTGSGALYAGKTGYTPVANTVVQVTGDLNDYIQVNLQNTNHSNTASMEIAITADDGNDTNNYIDMGIAGSTWDGTQTNSLGTAVAARDGYLYVQGGAAGGNLILGTTTAGYKVKFNAGGPGAANTVATISNVGIETSGIVSATGNVRGGNINTAGVISATSNIIGGNINTAGVISATGNITGGNLITGGAFQSASLASAGNLTFTANNANIVFNNTAYISGNANSLGRDGSIVLQPYTGAGSIFPGVLIGGAGRILAPNGSAHLVLNASDVTLQVVTKAVAIASTSTTSGGIQAGGGIGVVGNTYIGGSLVRTGAVSQAAWTTGGVGLQLPTAVYTDTTTAAGTQAASYIHNMAAPTMSFSNAVTVTNAATLQVAAPTAGTNATITNPYAIIATGAVSITGNVTVSGTGGVSQPNLPAFRVYGNTTSQFTAGTLTNQVVDYNQGSAYNNTTGIFTAPVAGLYLATGTLRIGSFNGLNQAAVLKNGSTLSTGNQIAFWEINGNSATAHMPFSGFAKLAVGDTLRLQIIGNSSVQFDSNDSWGVTFLG